MRDIAPEADILSGLFGDREVATCFTAAAESAAMLRVEAALALAQADLGLIPLTAAEEIAATAPALTVDAAVLADGMATAGVPVIALAGALRAAVGEAAAPYVHFGATSQDIMDTSLILRLEKVVDILTPRLRHVGDKLAGLADAHRTSLMAARTRTQQAVPTTFGLKVALWLLPFVRHRARLAELRPRLFAVQLGGAGGTQAAWGSDGPALSAAVARRLELAAPAAPWHGQRDNLVELANWLSLITGSLAKIGADLALMAQSEVAEVADGAGGGSSTMPQKANPIRAETLVALARSNAGHIATMHQALVHAHERDGSAWPLEWLALPALAEQTAAALSLAEKIFDHLQVDTARMAANVAASNGLILAEAGAFALADHMPRRMARDLVRDACAETASTGRHLVEVLAERTEAPVDWAALAEPANYLGSADEQITRILEAWHDDEGATWS